MINETCHVKNDEINKKLNEWNVTLANLSHR